MAEELIDSYIDREGIKKDTEYIVSNLNQVYQEFKKLDQVTLTLQGLKDMKSVIGQVNDLNENLKALAKTTVDLEKAKSKELDTDLKSQRVRTEAAKTAKESARAKEIESRMEKALNKEKEKTVNQLIKEEERLAKLSNAYEQLKYKYNLAANSAKQLAAAKGIDNAETKEAIAQAQLYYNSLIKIEGAVGQAQRKVGQYENATFALNQVLREAPAFANSFATGISAISNNVPMLVDQFKLLRQETGSGFKAFKILAGSLLSFQALLPLGFLLIQSYGKEISNFFGKIFSGGKAISDLERQQKLLNDTMRETGKAAADETVRLEVLYKVATNTALSVKERKKAVDELQDLYPAYFKNIKDEVILQGKAKEAYDATKAAILEAAKTRAIENKLQELSNKELELLQKKEETLIKQRKNDADKRKADASKADPELRGLEQFNAISEGSRITAKLEEINKELAGISKDREFLLNQITTAGIKPTKGTDSKDDPAKILEDALRAELDTYKIRKQALIDFSREISENEKLTLETRIAALSDWRTASEVLTVQSTKRELGIGKKTAQEKEKLSAEESAALLKIRVDYYKKVDDLIKKQSESDQQEQLKAQETIEKAIEDRFTRDLKRLEQMKEANQKAAEAMLKTDKKFADEKKKLMEDLVKEITSLAFTLFSAGIERDKNAIQEQIDLLEERKQKEIEVASQTIANAQERAAAVTVIEARAQAQRETLQRRQRDLDIKKAQFEKASSVVKIIQETAFNVVKYFANPVLAGLAAAIGAVQLAAVISQPIPRYKHGKPAGNNYEGPAIVGDGGRRELIVRADGSAELTPDTPTLTYVKAKDIVLPDAKAALAAAAANESGRALSTFDKFLTGYDGQNVEAAVKQMAGQVVTAIKKIPQPIIEAENIIRRRVRTGDSSNQYLNKNLQ